MELNITNALNSKGQKFPFELNEKILYNDERIQFEKPFCVKGEYYFNGQSINIAINVLGSLTYVCDRCGDESSMDIALKAEERVFSKETEDCDYTYENGVLSLDDMVFHNVLLNLPMQLLCNENCKGICLGCYANLNREECKCK
ncbi:MAG: DUF177 domain-containing protein [Clostridia bacterium]|nr:DUF177 domain-containing protein [Clostridia bacterium]